MKISACMIVKNEEKNIRKCIESYKKIVSEIIVVDTGSEDNTVNIAKELGAKVYYYEWNNSFSRAKNFALQKAKGDWIIFLDADEYFDSTDKLVQILNSINNQNVDCLITELINIDKDLDSVQDVNSIIRIFRNSPKIRFKNDIHEVLYKINQTLPAHVVENRDIFIYHTGYSTNIIESKVERNIKLIKESMVKNNDGFCYYYLCDSYFAIKKHELAIENGNKFIDTGKTLLGFNNKVYKNIIESMIALKYDNDEIRKVINRAKKIFHEHPMFYYHEAYIDYLECKYSSSLKQFCLTLEYQKKYKGIEMNIIPSIINLIYGYMAQIFEFKNDNVKATEYFVLSLKEDKYFEKAFVNLIDLIKNQPVEDIIILLNTIYDINKEKDVKFIIEKLIERNMGKVLMYYWNIWSKVFKKDDSTEAFVLMSNGYYESAFNKFLGEYFTDWTYGSATNTVLSALLSKNDEIVKFIRNNVKPGFRRIIDIYYFNDINEEFINDDIVDFINILKKIIVLCEKQTLVSFLKLKFRFKGDMSEILSDIFFESENYEMAIEHYDYMLTYIVGSDMELRKKVYFRKAVCHYKLNEYGEAFEFFKRMIDEGCKDFAIFEYLKWIDEKSNDMKFKENIRKVTNVVSVIK